MGAINVSIIGFITVQIFQTQNILIDNKTIITSIAIIVNCYGHLNLTHH